MILVSALSLLAMTDINQASKMELMKLKGVGSATADKIIAYRQKKCFESIEELLKVKGVGMKRFEALKSEIKAGECSLKK